MKVFLLLLTYILSQTLVFAAEQGAQPEGQPAPGVAGVAREEMATQSSNKKSKGGKRNRDKDADGTEAADRFEANTVIKSQYKLNGDPLEVDPD